MPLQLFAVGSGFIMCSGCAESVFSGTKTQFQCNKDSFFPDVTDEATATMHLSEIAEVRGACYIDECCDDLLFTHNDDIWYREN